MNLHNTTPTSWWRRVTHVLGLMVLAGSSLIAQTERIVPLGDGGFENAATFPGNGWTLSNSASVNQYVLGTINGTAPFVNRSAYTSNDGGATSNYTITANTLNYFYRDITVPAGETAITLSFNWFGVGELNWDMIQVFTAPTTVVPVGTITYPGTGLNNVPAGIAGATWVGSFHNISTPIQTATVVLPGTLAGTTFRLIFGWKSDNSVGAMPSVSLDNISLLSGVPTPPVCPSAYVPANLATGVLTNQVLSWSGAGGAPSPTYNVYFSTNQALVAAQDLSVRVLTGTSATTYAPLMNFNTQYYWMVVPANVAGGPPSCVVNTFTTPPPGVFTSTAIGGLFSSPATWVGNAVPPPGNDVIIADGAVVVVDQVVSMGNITVGQGISGQLHWNAVANAMTVSSNMLVNSGARLHMFTAAAAPNGVTINVGGNFTNNGTVHAAYVQAAHAFINFNVATSNSTLAGSGTFVGGIISQLFFQTNGANAITTTSPVTARSFGHTSGSLNTNGLLSINNTATVFGNAFNRQVYSVVVTAMGTGYNTATPPTITIAAPPAGIQATAVPVIDNVTGTLRAIAITNAGDGYRNNPLITISGGTGSGAAAVPMVVTQSIGTVSSLFQKGAIATITGGINITSHQGVGAMTTTNGGTGYTSAPTVGFGLPTGYLNLMTAPGSGYAAAPTVTVSGGTNINAGTNPTFTVTVASGQVTAVICTGAGTSLWSALPTLTLSAGGTTATAAFPPGCLPTATATISNGMVDNFTITNAGFGYALAPLAGVAGGGFPVAATTPLARVALYNLTYNFFLPAVTNPTWTEGAEMPANRRVNILTTVSSNGGNITGNLELYASAPMVFTNGVVNMGGNTLTFSHPTYAGATPVITSGINNGRITLSSPGGPAIRTFPFNPPFVISPGTTTNPASGSTHTSFSVERTGAPSGLGAIGTRAYRAITNPAKVMGATPTVTLNWNAVDALPVDQDFLTISQSTALTGPWTVRSSATGAGPLPATGGRTTGTVFPGPIAYSGTGNDFFAWTTPVASCPPPTSVVVAATSATIANVTFNCVSCTGTFIVEYGAPGHIPGSGATAGVGGILVPGGSSPIAVTGLTAGQTYHFFIRQVCIPGSDYSTNVGPRIFKAPEDLCGLSYYDSGGPSLAYGNNENIVRTFCPTTPGSSVTVTFNNFSTETGWDPLYVYDGPAITSPQIASTNAVPFGNNVYGTGGWWGLNTIPTPITSTHASGCLTFAFTSDGSVTNPGWDASVTCPPPSACTVPTSVAAPNVLTASATISWNCPSCVGPYIIEYGAPGFIPGTGATAGVGGTVVPAPSSPWTITGLTGGTAYRAYVRQDCDGLNTTFSNNSAPVNFTTAIGCGSAYNDPGGPSNPYPPNINGTAGQTIICPTNPTDKILVNFTSFNTESGWDPLYVFNGPTAGSPLISSGNGVPTTTPNLGAGGWWGTVAPTNTATPGLVLSTDVTGCLTFRFISDASVQNAGWTSTVACAAPQATCAAAGTIACGQIKQGFTIGGTNSLPVTACPFNGAVSNSGVSWWQYTALATEEVTISTCNLASFNTRLSIFHAPAADCTVLDCVAMNDDTPGCASNSSEVILAATAGQTYYIAVHGSGTATGVFSLSITCAQNCSPSSANDKCGTASAITPVLNDGFGVPITGDNTCAYVEAGTTCSGTGPVAGVWYTFNSDTVANMTISLLDQDINAFYTATALSYALYDGACSNLLAAGEVACDATGEGYDQPLPTLTLSTQYKLLIYNAGGVGTEGTFGAMLEFPGDNDAGISDVIYPDGLVCTSAIEAQVELTNYGADPLATVDILYSVDLGPQQTFNWVGVTPLATGQSIIVTLPSLAVTQAAHTFEATVANPNGRPDEIAGNNPSNSSFNSSGEAVSIVIEQDQFGAQLTWEIYDALEIAPLVTGGPYTNLGAPGTMVHTSTHCLPIDFGNCFTLRVLDSFGDGMCCAFGLGKWQVRSTGGAWLIGDAFQGSGTLAGSSDNGGSNSPNASNPSYTGHEFCLPKGPADIESHECGVYNNTLNNKVYCKQAPGTGNYQFEFLNPDFGYRRRISVVTRYVQFSQLQTQPLVAGTHYFVRARRDAANDGYFNDNWGSGCETGLDPSVVAGCGQLINDIGSPTHSCGVTKSFGYSDKVWAQPILGATQYRFRFVGSIDPDGPNGPMTPSFGTRQITQASYVRVLNWFTSTLVDGETYNVTVEVFVNGVWSGFCGPICTVTIDNPPAFGGRGVEVTAESDVQLYPNPTRDGNVNLVLNGLTGLENTVTVDIYDVFGKLVYSRSIGTEGATEVSTVLALGKSLASGLYMVDITMGDRHSIQRLSIL